MVDNTITVTLGNVENSCFVAMPFSQFFTSEYEKVIKPALEELNIKCVRGDEIYSRQRIMDDIWISIRRCRFVLAELTGRNPNVMYEIGLAHAIGKPIIIITRKEDDVPFDLKSLRYLFYDINDPFWGENLKTSIALMCKKIVDAPNSEMYLDGISQGNNINYPAIQETQPNPKKKKTQRDVSGTWKGEYDIEGEIFNLIMQIDQKDDSISAVVAITYFEEGEVSVVQQLMNGTIRKNLISLLGLNYTFVHQGKSDGYVLDTFELELVNSISMHGLGGDTNKQNGRITLTKEEKKP